MSFTDMVRSVILRFNRYIVECKFALLERKSHRLIGFNRYIVECKFYIMVPELNSVFRN